MNRFEFQLAMLQKGAEEIEKKVAGFTSILFQIKTIVITLLTALIGWAFTAKIDSLIPVGYFVVFGFWILEARFWTVQCYYMNRAKELTEYLNNEKALDESFKNQSIPYGLVYPLGSLKTIQPIPLVTGLKAPSLWIFYTFLSLINSVVWLIAAKLH